MKENNIKDRHDIETEYLGSEETKYEGDYNEYNEETEYIESKTGKAPKDTIINQRYKIVETIGKGGMGAVYKALDIRLRNTPVAIKEISLETIENERIEKVIENFENEAQTLIGLRHNAIPRVMDFFSLSNNRCYIVMDLIDGETLDQVIMRRGCIPEGEVRNWIYQIADVLKYLHSREPKIIFRDLKPSNVMLTKENEIKLIDFGIARTFKENKATDTTYYVSQGFSPPEQYGTGQSDERSDIYSLGALTYSLLIGGKPKIKDFKFEDLKEYIDVSDELNNAIITATDFRPENRPNTVDEFINLFSNKEKQTNSEDEIFNNKSKFNKNKRIVAIISIALIVLVGSKLNIMEKIIYKNNSEAVNESSEYDVVNTMSTQKNDNLNIEDEGIKKAIEAIYKANGFNEEDVKYQYSPDENYVKESEIKENYYIFIERHSPDTDYEIWSDYNMLVNKETFEVYIYPAGGPLQKYENERDSYHEDEYYSYEESLYPYQENWEEECKTIHIPYGYECTDSDSHQMLRRDLSSSGTSGERGNTLDIEITGFDWYKEECIKLHNGKCKSIGEHEIKIYNMDELYKKYTYALEKETIDSIFSDGLLNGYNYILYNEDKSKEAIEEYVYVNCPENASEPIWKAGFEHAYKKYISIK